MSSPNQGGEGVGGESSPSADESFHGGVTIPFQKVSSAGHAAPNGVAPLEAGQRFGEFEIIAILGKGGMGAVYKALQVRCGGGGWNYGVGSSAVACKPHPTHPDQYGHTKCRIHPRIQMRLFEKGSLKSSAP
ncbi:MAG: hypothetical protein RIS92_2951 [Verrucomicrobiota bacterium]|jgi:hypothetical protein